MVDSGEYVFFNIELFNRWAVRNYQRDGDATQLVARARLPNKRNRFRPRRLHISYVIFFNVSLNPIKRNSFASQVNDSELSSPSRISIILSDNYHARHLFIIPSFFSLSLSLPSRENEVATAAVGKAGWLLTRWPAFRVSADSGGLP